MLEWINKMSDEKARILVVIIYILFCVAFVLVLSGCSTTPCAPKSDTEVIAGAIVDILQPSIKIGC
jgi:hypothetical protein